MHHLFDVRLVNADTLEPGLIADLRDERRSLLFDLGEIASLAPRTLMRVSQAFVTHQHMDHFAGFDHLLKVVLGRKERIELYGGPGFASKVEHKLAAYSWNVVHRYDVPLVIVAHEIAPEGSSLRTTFDSRNAFERGGDEPFSCDADVVHDEFTFRVRARFVDHDIRCLAFALEEKAHVNVRKERLVELGYGVGAWLRELKHAVLTGAPDDTPIDVRWRDRDGDHAVVRPLGELRDIVLDVVPGRRVGYATDLRFTDANVTALTELFRDVDLLFIECVFLDEDRDHAARKNHLTARQAGAIAREVGARAVVPFHISPRYEGRGAELIAEMQRSWHGTP